LTSRIECAWKQGDPAGVKAKPFKEKKGRTRESEWRLPLVGGGHLRTGR
jgi:hypothetical protein